ncbi:hypothetical protein BT93_G0009 [Corymbia citriodora subsp. variegata]|nr:hypothetical protein BT93_G0009 [Corymbia citriodora subsp. variegata]
MEWVQCFGRKKKAVASHLLQAGPQADQDRRRPPSSSSSPRSSLQGLRAHPPPRPSSLRRRRREDPGQGRRPHLADLRHPPEHRQGPGRFLPAVLDKQRIREFGLERELRVKAEKQRKREGSGGGFWSRGLSRENGVRAENAEAREHKEERRFWLDEGGWLVRDWQLLGVVLNAFVAVQSDRSPRLSGFRRRTQQASSWTA